MKGRAYKTSASNNSAQGEMQPTQAGHPKEEGRHAGKGDHAGGGDEEDQEKEDKERGEDDEEDDNSQGAQTQTDAEEMRPSALAASVKAHVETLRRRGIRVAPAKVTASGEESIKQAGEESIKQAKQGKGKRGAYKCKLCGQPKKGHVCKAVTKA
jgi:hypothetical protein